MRTHTSLTLRKLIVEDMDINKYQMTAQEISVWIETLPGIVEEMFQHLHFFYFGIFAPGMVRKQIQQVQRECIYLMDAAGRYQALPKAMLPLQKAVIAALDQILEKIDSNYGKHASDELQMPLLHLKKEQVWIENQLDVLRACFLKNKTCPQLQKLVIEAFASTIKAKRCDYQRMKYIKTLLSALTSIKQDFGQQFVNDNLQHQLLELNYNSPAFVKYCQGVIKEELAAIEDVKHQYRLLYSYEQLFAKHTYRKAAPCFDAKCRPVKEQLLQFVATELDYLNRQEKLKQPVMPVAVPSAAGAVVVTGGPYKIRTDMSVDQLAYFFKLLIKAKVIDAGVRTELMAFVGRSFQTPGIGVNGISPASLETKYKQVVQSTAKSLRARLVLMLKLLDEEFGF